MTDTKEPEIPFEARLVLSMRNSYAGFMAEQHTKWKALEKVREGSYTNDYRRVPWKTRYRSPQGIVQLEHQKAIALKALPVPRAISDSEADIAEGLTDIANAALDSVAAAIDYNRLCDGVMDDAHVYGAAVLKILVRPNQDLDVRLVNLRNLYPHPLAESLADCEALVEDIILPLSAALRRWPDKRAALYKAAALRSEGPGADSKGQQLYQTPNDYDKAAEHAEVTLPQALTVPVRLHEAWFRTDESLEVVEEFFEPGDTNKDGTPKRNVRKKKRKKYPGGRHIIVTSEGDVILDEPNYDPEGRFPYVMVGCYWRPHKFWPKGDLEFMAPTIILLDEMVSAIADAAKHLAYPSFAVDPRRAKVDRSLLIYRPGQWIPILDPNHSLRPIDVPPMHDSVYNLIPLLRGNLRVGSGTPDESRGERPRGDVTGKSIEAMAALASIRPGLKHANFERAMAELFQRLFAYMQKYWTRPRKLVVNPQANDIAMRRIMQDPPPTTTPNPISHKVLWWQPDAMRNSQVRIIVEPGSGAPEDPEMEYQALLSLVELLATLDSNPALLGAQEIIPKSYLISHSPLRNKAMIMRRAYRQEFRRAREQGVQEGMAEALRNMSAQDLQAFLYQQAAGNGSPQS